MPLPQRSAIGSSFQASMWQKCPVLLDVEEMKDLMVSLGSFWLVKISGVMLPTEAIFSPESFLEVYKIYIDSLKKGTLSDDVRIRTYFSSVWTSDLEALYTVPVGEGKCLVKVSRPVIQLQAHRFDYSTADGNFRSMVLGNDCVQWGIQFSYPHMFQDEQLQVHTVREGEEFPNTALFKQLQRWMRANTLATPFEVEGKKVNVPIRLGKQCLPWINAHPQLKAKKLSVKRT